MSPTREQSTLQSTQRALNLTMATFAGQAGCLTIIIILAALFLGLWLDKVFNSARHVFTFVLVLASIPVTVLVMIWVSRAAISRIKAETKQDSQNALKEE